MAANAQLRRALHWLHRWLGLSLGLIFAVVALSGSLLLFQPQYFTWAHGHMIPGGLVQEPGSIDAWVENGRATVPGLGEPIAIWRPHVSHNVSEAGMLIFAGLEPGGLGNMGIVGILVAPATGRVLGTFNVDRSPAYAPIFLHRDLWTGEAGRIVNGVMAIGSLLFLLIGLYLWWPRPARILRKLSPRPWRTTLTNVALLHEWTGVWTLVALLVLVASGLYLVQPTWVEPTLALLPDRHQEKAHDQSACQEAGSMPRWRAQATWSRAAGGQPYIHMTKTSKNGRLRSKPAATPTPSMVIPMSSPTYVAVPLPFMKHRKPGHRAMQQRSG